MIVPKHLHHVRPSTRSIEEARKLLKHGPKDCAIQAIYRDDYNINAITNGPRLWSLQDSIAYVYQVLMVEEKRDDK